MCPVCSEPLVAFELDGVEIDRCLECGGTWLDSGELERLAETAGAEVGKLSAALNDHSGGKHGNRRCVRCPWKLRIVIVSEVELDHCPNGHGLWFDRSELGKLVSSFTDGEEGAVAHFFGDLDGGGQSGEEQKGD